MFSVIGWSCILWAVFNFSVAIIYVKGEKYTQVMSMAAFWMIAGALFLK